MLTLLRVPHWNVVREGGSPSSVQNGTRSSRLYQSGFCDCNSIHGRNYLWRKEVYVGLWFWISPPEIRQAPLSCPSGEAGGWQWPRVFGEWKTWRSWKKRGWLTADINPGCCVWGTALNLGSQCLFLGFFVERNATPKQSCSTSPGRSRCSHLIEWTFRMWCSLKLSLAVRSFQFGKSETPGCFCFLSFTETHCRYCVICRMKRLLVYPVIQSSTPAKHPQKHLFPVHSHSLSHLLPSHRQPWICFFFSIDLSFPCVFALSKIVFLCMCIFSRPGKNSKISVYASILFVFSIEVNEHFSK